MSEAIHKMVNLERLFNKPLSVSVRVILTKDERRWLAESVGEADVRHISRKWIQGWVRNLIARELSQLDRRHRARAKPATDAIEEIKP